LLVGENVRFELSYISVLKRFNFNIKSCELYNVYKNSEKVRKEYSTHFIDKQFNKWNDKEVKEDQQSTEHTHRERNRK
jgi:hypothetical protein